MITAKIINTRRATLRRHIVQLNFTKKGVDGLTKNKKKIKRIRQIDKATQLAQHCANELMITYKDILIKIRQMDDLEAEFGDTFREYRRLKKKGL